MKTAIVQFDSRPFDALGLMPFLLQRNKAYAARHGYAYHYLNTPSVDLPVYWLKPHIVRQLLGAYDLVAWVDTDAVFHDLERKIEPLFEGSEIMVGAGDNPYWATPLNTGVFFVKAAGGRGAALMQRWSDLFAGTAWTRTAEAWVCDTEWAGADFEQGAFNLHLTDELVQSGDLRLTDWQTLQSPFPLARSFTLHFAGRFKMNLPAYMDIIAQ